MSTDTDRPIPVRKNMSAPQPRAGAEVFPGRAGAGDPPASEEPITDAERRAGDAAPRKPTVTFTLHALVDDFPFDVQFSGSADLLKGTVARLKELGAVPPTVAARQAVEAERQREAPVCQYHGPMKESTKAPGTWYCPAKMGDNSYCKSKA
jgi:hypothetical protein